MIGRLVVNASWLVIAVSLLVNAVLVGMYIDGCLGVVA